MGWCCCNKSWGSPNSEINKVWFWRLNLKRLMITLIGISFSGVGNKKVSVVALCSGPGKLWHIALWVWRWMLVWGHISTAIRVSDKRIH
jgi:hypothetical protein